MAIQAAATDQLGNTATTDITVFKFDIPPDAFQLTVVSGNNQSARVGAILPEPIVVQVARPDGLPLANKLVMFEVIRSDGRVRTDGISFTNQPIQVRTDANGQASASWELGLDTGFGNNRVEVTSTSVVGTAAFYASAMTGPPRRSI